jgi:hypothetical protein
LEGIKEGGEGCGMVLCLLPLILVALIDSIVENADFISLE